MWHEHLRTDFRGNEPIACQRDSRHSVRLFVLRFLPSFKIDCAGKWRQHQELSEWQPCSLRELTRGIERLLAIARQAENKRAEHMHAILTKLLELAHKVVSRSIEILVNCLRA